MDGVRLEAAVRALGDPRRLIGRIAEEALQLIPSAEGSVVELDEGDHLRYECAAGTLGPHVGLRLESSGSLSGLSVQLGSTLRCDDSETDPRVDREACRRVAARSMVCVPLKCGDRYIGVLKVTSAQPNAFSDRDVETLAGLASFIGMVVTAAGQLEQVTGEWHSLPLLLEAADGGRDIAGMSAFVANVLQPGVIADLQAAQRIQAVLNDRSFRIAHQPIVDLRSGLVVASEALSRFTDEPSRTTEQWFRDAWRTGLGAELELATAAAALDELHRLPDECRLAINVSTPVVERYELADLLHTVDPARVVLEVTENVDAENFERTRQFLAPLRLTGAQVAMDDAGTGFSGLSRIIELAPDIIKLDRVIIQGIDLDPVRRSLAMALVTFAQDVGAVVVAEGVETVDQLEVVSRLGIQRAQGYLIGRPGPVETLPRAFDVGVGVR